MISICAGGGLSCSPATPQFSNEITKTICLEGIFAPVNYQRFHMYFMRGNDVSRRRAEPVKVLYTSLCNLEKLLSIKLWLKSPFKLVLT